jgi:hypothetical protein
MAANDYFDENDPSILHVIYQGDTTWEEVMGEITSLRNLPPERFPIHLIIQFDDATALLQETMVGRFSAFENVFRDNRIGLRVCVHKSFEIRLLIMLFIRLYPAFKNRLFITPTVEAAYALIQREKNNLR